MTETKLKALSGTKKKISVTVPQEKVGLYMQKAYQKVGSKAKVKGFREGKVPKDLLDQYFKAEIEYECLNFLISDSYMLALQEHKLIPITEPKFDAKPIEQNKNYSYHVEIETKPEFELKDYVGIKLKKQDVEVTSKEFDEEMKKLQESLAQLSPTEKDTVITNGLVATIDFDGTMDGKAFAGSSAKDYMFEYGNKTLLKEFEENLKGMKAGGSKEFSMTFPKDYFEKTLAGKKADYKVTLTALHNKNLPKLDDELAKDIGKENLDQVKKEVRDAIVSRKERQVQRDYGEKIKEHIKKNYKFDVPESIVEAEVERNKQDKQEVIDQIRMELVLEAVARKENLMATRQDLQDRMHLLAQIYRRPLEEIQKIYAQENMIQMLASQIAFDKAIDYMIKNAKIS